ncbi:unnamed protein product [Oncorhynchus mykiss]|uniref:Golgin subfamily A member 7 n=1 Tax=Oncorhynchus mykiss TaxID=8022 RepID=A0A060W7V9_ONCMY|nr:unnamed protein product [Oncorhynchus mykiss]
MGNVYLRFINSIYNFKNSKIFCSLFLQSALQFAATEPRELDNLYPDTLVAVLSLELAEGKQRAVNMAEIDKQQFEETVRTLNNLYAEAEKLGGSSYLEGCLACLTAYTIFLCMETHYEKVLKKIAKFIQEQNDKIYAPRGLLLTDPIERGLRVVEVTIFEDRSLGR